LDLDDTLIFAQLVWPRRLFLNCCQVDALKMILRSVDEISVTDNIILDFVLKFVLKWSISLVLSGGLAVLGHFLTVESVEDKSLVIQAE
jgi:hypothetical protein